MEGFIIATSIILSCFMILILISLYQIKIIKIELETMRFELRHKKEE